MAAGLVAERENVRRFARRAKLAPDGQPVFEAKAQTVHLRQVKMYVGGFPVSARF